MKELTLLIPVFWLLSCSAPKEEKENRVSYSTHQATAGQYAWTKKSDSAEWRKSYHFQMLSMRDTLWVFHYDGNWYSVNGKDWTKSALSNPVGNLAFVDYVQFKDAVYGIGHFEGNIEKFSLKNEIYKTTDLKQWQVIAKESNLPKRFFYHPFVFNNKIWIIGGEDKNGRYADVWNSADGIKWSKQKDHLPFGKRSRCRVVQLHNKLFLLDNDVWSSTDGLNWQKETDGILKGETIFGYAAVIFNHKIWLLGCNRNGLFSSRVLVSADGKNWTSEEAPWTPRGGIAATVYKEAIYMTGGKYGGTADHPEFIYSNDVWAYEKKSN